MFDCGRIKRKEWIQCALVAVVTFAAAGLLLFIRIRAQAPGAYVTVLLDGREYARYSLMTDGTYRIDTGENDYNIVTVRNGSVSVTEASCPNQVCVHTRAVRHAGEAISCLPHRLQLLIEGGGQAEYDAITD